MTPPSSQDNVTLDINDKMAKNRNARTQTSTIVVQSTSLTEGLTNTL